MRNLLDGKRVLITQAREFMGPTLCEVFAEQGAEVVASTETLREPEAATRVVHAVGDVDAIVVNLAITAREDAEFAAYLCSDAASCFVGQVFPVCGGWVAR